MRNLHWGILAAARFVYGCGDEISTLAFYRLFSIGFENHSKLWSLKKDQQGLLGQCGDASVLLGLSRMLNGLSNG